MTAQTNLKSLHFNSAAYRIRVYGCLSPEWSDCLQGMTVTVFEEKEKEGYTELSGWLPDQAALMGVLQHLYNCNIPIISMEIVGAEHETERLDKLAETECQQRPVSLP